MTIISIHAKEKLVFELYPNFEQAAAPNRTVSGTGFNGLTNGPPNRTESQYGESECEGYSSTHCEIL